MAEPPKSDRLQGWNAPLSSPEDRARAMELAFDYRGNITIETSDGRRIEGYVFDRRADGVDPYLRMMPASGGRVDIPYDQIRRLTFSDRDPAAGKSWEAWVKKYVQTRTGGKGASVNSEPRGPAAGGVSGK